jgi:hypothetical protein
MFFTPSARQFLHRRFRIRQGNAVNLAIEFDGQNLLAGLGQASDVFGRWRLAQVRPEASFPRLLNLPARVAFKDKDEDNS